MIPSLSRDKPRVRALLDSHLEHAVPFKEHHFNRRSHAQATRFAGGNLSIAHPHFSLTAPLPFFHYCSGRPFPSKRAACCWSSRHRGGGTKLWPEARQQWDHPSPQLQPTATTGQAPPKPTSLGCHFGHRAMRSGFRLPLKGAAMCSHGQREGESLFWQRTFPPDQPLQPTPPTTAQSLHLTPEGRQHHAAGEDGRAGPAFSPRLCLCLRQALAAFLSSPCCTPDSSLLTNGTKNG